jgi:hypothetical protein
MGDQSYEITIFIGLGGLGISVKAAKASKSEKR